MDALTQLFGSMDFLAATESFQPAFRAAVTAQHALCDLGEAQGGQLVISQERRDLKADLEAKVDQLAQVLYRIRAVARSEVIAELSPSRL